jgi:hypothetical protein
VRRSLTIAALFLLTATLVVRYVYIGEGIDAFYQSRLGDMVHGTAYRPFVGRVLAPGVARLLTAAVPDGVKRGLTAVFAEWTWRPAGWQPAIATEYVLVVAIMTASLVGFAFAIRRLFHTVFQPRTDAAWAAAFGALIGLPAFFGPFSRQIYDFTTLWLFTLGLTLIAESRWRAFALLFPIACVNKETTILLSLVFAWHGRRTSSLSSATYRRLLVYQAVVFVAVRGAIAYAFRRNPGQNVLLHLFLHNEFVLIHPSQMSLRLPLLVGVTLVGLWRWHQKPIFLRDAFVVLAPALALMGVTVGWIDEIRAYYEIYPVIVLLVADTVRAVLSPQAPAVLSTWAADRQRQT